MVKAARDQSRPRSKPPAVKAARGQSRLSEVALNTRYRNQAKCSVMGGSSAANGGWSQAIRVPTAEPGLPGIMQSRNNASRFVRNGSAERRGSPTGCTTMKWSPAENFLLFLLLGGLRSSCFFRGSLLRCSLLGCTFRCSLLRRCLLGCGLLRCGRCRSSFFCCLLLRHCTSSVVIGLLSVPSRRLPVCLLHQRGDVADYVVRLACDHSQVRFT